MSFQSISKNVIYLSLIIGISVVLGFDDGLLSTIIVFILICIVIAGLVMYFNWKNKILAPFLPYLMALFIGIAAVSYYKDSTNNSTRRALREAVDDYRKERYQYPQKIEDLIPEYLTTYPLYLGAFARKDSFIYEVEAYKGYKIKYGNSRDSYIYTSEKKAWMRVK